jgi:hypothetical protein
MPEMRDTQIFNEQASLILVSKRVSA